MQQFPLLPILVVHGNVKFKTVHGNGLGKILPCKYLLIGGVKDSK